MDGLRRLVRALSASARTLPAASGVSGAQLFVLRQISSAPGLSLRELSARTLTGQSTVSEVVSRLVERGLVERSTSAADGRQAALTLTAKGRKLIARSEATAQERLTSALDSLPTADREALATGIEHWLTAAGLAETPATMFFETDRSVRRAAKRTRSRTPSKR